MKDSEIVALYWERSEEAVAETKAKYGWYCTSIAYQILSSVEDSEECVSDAYWKTWSSIPPNRPEDLRSYIGKITRNLALNRIKAGSAKKRGEVPLVLEELEVASLDTVENEMDRNSCQKRSQDSCARCRRRSDGCLCSGIGILNPLP